MSYSTILKRLSLKLVIDRKAKRILYAEADKTFIDFLFTMLSLPFATLMKLISISPISTTMFWSLGNLYSSVKTLDIKYFKPNETKEKLLNPKSQLDTVFQIESSSSLAPPTNYYTCCGSYFTSTVHTQCPKCFKSMVEPATYVYGLGELKPFEGGLGYVEGGVRYMVMDDLTVKPIFSSMSTILVLKELEVDDVRMIDEKLVYLDIDEGLKLLKASMQSYTVLTDVLFHKIIDFSTTDSCGKKRKPSVFKK
ncbi:uncharacterized protein LOC103500190 [Cucumis melo]|uniref:Uncharacterized protein LOC103500190 n=1 Tax=Cucumis melo TaxID=3656 RepID=A0A1S3CF63_CUCME|nr:uncharacterized protein LOC103500190 [Cucumis melo]